jgi:ketosteroid isomerase-like protein
MTTATTATATLAERITECLRAGDYDRLAELYRPDALLDSNVPYWRYQLQGPRAILAQLREEEGSLSGWRCTGLRATATEDGVVVETEVRFDHEGEERLWRDVHIVHTDGQAITEHVIYCCGIWDAATIARQQAEAPMVRV